MKKVCEYLILSTVKNWPKIFSGSSIQVLSKIGKICHYHRTCEGFFPDSLPPTSYLGFICFLYCNPGNPGNPCNEDRVQCYENRFFLVRIDLQGVSSTGFGFAVFVKNNSQILKVTDKRLTVSRWLLLFGQKHTQNVPTFSDPICLPKPKSLSGSPPVVITEVRTKTGNPLVDECSN